MRQSDISPNLLQIKQNAILFGPVLDATHITIWVALKADCTLPVSTQVSSLNP